MMRLVLLTQRLTSLSLSAAMSLELHLLLIRLTDMVSIFVLDIALLQLISEYAVRAYTIWCSGVWPMIMPGETPGQETALQPIRDASGATWNGLGQLPAPLPTGNERERELIPLQTVHYRVQTPGYVPKKTRWVFLGTPT